MTRAQDTILLKDLATLIPGAAALYWPKALEPGARPFLLDGSDVATLYDQEGIKDLVGGTSKPTINVSPTGRNISLVFTGGQALTRNDALGLIGDPALTIAWKMFANFGSAGQICGFGTAAAIEINVDVSCGSGADQISITDATGLLGVNWYLPPHSISNNWHQCVYTKAAGGGWGAPQTLSVDNVDQGIPATQNPGAIAIGNELTLVGDFPGGGYPFEGLLRGPLIWPRVLTDQDMGYLQTFLAQN